MNTHQYRIVRRAYGAYVDVASYRGGPLDALEFSVEMERERNDGEYLVRGLDQPNWEPGASYQSPFDWL